MPFAFGMPRNPQSVSLFFSFLLLSLDIEVAPIRRFEALRELIDVIVTDQLESTWMIRYTRGHIDDGDGELNRSIFIVEQ